MKNINEYKRRFYNLMESEMGDVRPLINERVIRESEEDAIEGEEVAIEAEDATKDLSRDEKEFLKNYIEENGIETLQDKIADQLENEGSLTELDEDDEMGETEYKLRKILDKVITYGAVGAGLAALPAAMFISGGVAAGLGAAALAGTILKDAAWYKRGGKYSDHHYGPSDKSRDWRDR